MNKKHQPPQTEGLAQRLLQALAKRDQPRRGAGKWLAKRYGVSGVTANAWLNGVHKMDVPTARRMAKDFNMTFEEFYFGAQPSADVQVESTTAEISYVPLISFTTAGNWGEICDSYQPGDGKRPVMTTRRVSSRAFALRVRGDSMEPRIEDGAIIIVDPEVEPVSGKMVVVRQNHDSEATVKTFVRDGNTVFLKPENPRYPIMQMMDDALICGVVLQVTKDVG